MEAPSTRPLATLKAHPRRHDPGQGDGQDGTRAPPSATSGPDWRYVVRAGAAAARTTARSHACTPCGSCRQDSIASRAGCWQAECPPVLLCLTLPGYLATGCKFMAWQRPSARAIAGNNHVPSRGNFELLFSRCYQAWRTCWLPRLCAIRDDSVFARPWSCPDCFVLFSHAHAMVRASS